MASADAAATEIPAKVVTQATALCPDGPGCENP